MRRSQLAFRSLIYYWRTNLAVVAGVGTAVAVLGGALLVGDSVRGSLRDLVLLRLGRTDQVVASATFFRERLADALRARPSFADTFSDVAPMVVAPGFVTAQESGRRVGQVRVYGVDDRFWRFHGLTEVTGPGDGDAFVSEALAKQIDAQSGATILVRVQRPSEIPLESLHGRKEGLGQTLRLTVRSVVPPGLLGDFSLEAQQAEVHALFVPLSRLQGELEIEGRVNTLLVSEHPGRSAPAVDALEELVRSEAGLEDVGLTVRLLESRGIVVESDKGVLDDTEAGVVRDAFDNAGVPGVPVFTYLANTLRRGDREVPYSLVTAVDLRAVAPAAAPAADAATFPVVLTEWAADELEATVGDAITMEYYVWEDPGRLVTRSAGFHVAAIVPVAVGDRDLTPVYPGITDSPSLADWDPPFPIDLRRIRPADEAYWELYRTTPKAYVPLEAGQRLWRSRYGAVTSVRAPLPEGRPIEDVRASIEQQLRERVDPLRSGLAVRDVRVESIEASRGATDFGEYFVYFSFFLVVSALLLAALFFKLGVEQRVREVGLLRAVGFRPAAVRGLFLREALLLSLIGSALGVAGAVGYAFLIMTALGTWWIGAVGTTALTLHVSPASLATGAAGGVLSAMVCIWWTLRGLARVSERGLLVGQTETPAARARASQKVRIVAAFALSIAAAALILAAAIGLVARTGAFFGAGAALLAASLCIFAVLLRGRPWHPLAGRGWRPISWLGVRSATDRPGRSVLSAAVIASATFILISVDAFRRDAITASDDPRSGVGGYQLLVESLLPIVHDPNSADGRQALNLTTLGGPVAIEPFRVLPGDDASCLNLYEPRNPRIVAPRDSFLELNRFAFQASLASTDAERANPWRLLHREEPDGAIPVIADANSMTYVLHRRLGEDIVVTRGSRQIRLRLVAALRDSIFQRELLMSQAHFVRLFPEQEGYRFLLVETPLDRASSVAAGLEEALSDLGADASGTVERLEAFHQVENTYLSTFQTLGGLGLLLGTIGLGTVLFRNVLERRRELALLGAVGYRRSHFQLMVMAETVLLLAAGLAAGVLCASLAIAPAVAERGGRLPVGSGAALLLFSVFLAGLLSSVIATRVATGGPLLPSLRSE